MQREQVEESQRKAITRSKLITTIMWEKGIEKYKNSHIQAIAIASLRRGEQESSTSKTFVRLIVLDYKSVKQSRQRVSSNSVSLV